MADVVFTAANVVRPDTLSNTQTGLSGAAISVGQLCYFDSASNTWKVGNATAAITATAPLWGFALNSTAAANQVISVLTSGNLTVTGLTSGKPYVLSGLTAGAVADAADLVTNIATWYGVFAGFATSATNLRVPPGGPFPSTVL